MDKSTLLEQSNEGAVLVKFHASWCNPCKKMAPILDEVLQDFTDLGYHSVDIDENMELPSEFGVMGVPTLILLRGGEEAARLSGAQSEEALRSFLES